MKGSTRNRLFTIAISTCLISALLWIGIRPVWLRHSLTGKIVFVRLENGNCNIYIINANGSNLVRLTQGHDINLAPNYSSINKKIVFTSDQCQRLQPHGIYRDIFMMDIDGSNQKDITKLHGNFDPLNYGWNTYIAEHPSWSPNGKQITLIIFEDLYVMDIDSGVAHARQLIPDDRRSGVYSEPNWSPDGKRIVFVVSPDQPESGLYPRDIYIINTDGSNIKRLTHDKDSQEPAWSPDSRRITFRSNGKIIVMNWDGTNKVSLTDHSDTIDSEPSWSPDGKKIVFSRMWIKAGKERKGCIFVMDADGSNQICLTHEDDSGPIWLPDR